MDRSVSCMLDPLRLRRVQTIQARYDELKNRFDQESSTWLGVFRHNARDHLMSARLFVELYREQTKDSRVDAEGFHQLALRVEHALDEA